MENTARKAQELIYDAIKMDLKKRIMGEEYGLEPFSSIGSQLLAVQKKVLNFREPYNWLSDCQVLKNESASWRS